MREPQPRRAQMLDALRELETALSSCAAYLRKGNAPDLAMSNSVMPVLRHARRVISKADLQQRSS